MHSVLFYVAAVLGGAYSAFAMPIVPSEGFLTAIFLVAITATTMVVILKREVSPVLACFCAVFLMASCSARSLIDDRLDSRSTDQTLRQDVEAVFRVADFPRQQELLLRMLVEPVDKTSRLPTLIRLSWYEPSEIPRMGECWMLTVRLRAPRGSMNPGGFDYEGWLFRAGIGATGYVRSATKVAECSGAGVVSRLRAHLAHRIAALLPDDGATAVILAVTLGARHRIANDEWQRYAVTGTSHLMAISGMHIGLAAGSCYVLGMAVIALLRRNGNNRLAALAFACVVASAYAVLSGFAVPARRAVIMLVVFTAAALLRRFVGPFQLLGGSCVAIVALTPVDILSPGFKLSFGAVVILLLLGSGRRASRAQTRLRYVLQKARQLVVLQVWLLLGMLPLTAALFGRAAWIAPMVNLLVLPVFNLLAVPLALAGAALPIRSLADLLLRGAWESVGLILLIVERAAALPGADLVIANLDGLALAIACLSAIWVVLPPGFPGRPVALLAALATLWHAPERPPERCADIHVLDVGQGLATVVTTRNRTLLFDAGPAFRSGANAGDFAVIPFLRGLGVAALDLMVISHADQDHAGGAIAVHSEVSAAGILLGEDVDKLSGIECRAGMLWFWDDVRFAVLHPSKRSTAEGNNASCVLEISSGSNRTLLTGDIEATSERRLIEAGLIDRANLVVIPHHGSKTSSHPEFVDRVRPAVAVASTGFANRWNMPNATVEARWRAADADFYNTAVDGAVSFRLCANGLTLLGAHRRDARRLWHAM